MTSVNQVCQVGPSVLADGFPAKHALQPANLGAKVRLDLLNGQSSVGATGGDSRSKKKNIHGILNAVSWGILFPVGVIIARYLRTFPSADPTWFYLHAFCQVSAYAVGIAGWATRLKLGSESKCVTYKTHRTIGITLFSLATVQEVDPTVGLEETGSSDGMEGFLSDLATSIHGIDEGWLLLTTYS